MYKVTLWDNNCPSCTSGVTEFYCDNIYRFRREWEHLESDEKRKERFDRSICGEIVTDYYSNSPDLNIVQKDDKAVIIKERIYNIKHKKLTLRNGYGYPSTYYIHDMNVCVRWIKYRKNYIKIGSFIINGIARDSIIKSEKYADVQVYGNSILKREASGKDTFKSNKLSDFKNVSIESICFIPYKGFRNILEVMLDIRANKLSDEDLDMLLRDIPGEAG